MPSSKNDLLAEAGPELPLAFSQHLPADHPVDLGVGNFAGSAADEKAVVLAGRGQVPLCSE